MNFNINQQRAYFSIDNTDLKKYQGYCSNFSQGDGPPLQFPITANAKIFYYTCSLLKSLIIINNEMFDNNSVFVV